MSATGAVKERETTPDLWEELSLASPGRRAFIEPIEAPLEDESVADLERRHRCPYPDLREVPA